ncbi:MAG: ABC-2 transporter permease [Bacillota bacterium]|nr:ABC-2 transporter permease [Bacillota bacterium]
MKGLILKDLLNMKQQWKVYLLVIVAWFVLSIFNDNYAFFGSIMVMLVILLPMTSMAYDDKVGWEHYALTMPVSRKDLMFSRYLILLLIALCAGVISVAGGFLISRNLQENIMFMLVLMPLGLMMGCVLLPIMFRFGVEKGRYVFLGIFILLVVAFLLMKRQGLLIELASSWGLLTVSQEMLALLLWGAALVVFLASVLVSGGIYRRKDF